MGRAQKPRAHMDSNAFNQLDSAGAKGPRCMKGSKLTQVNAAVLNGELFLTGLRISDDFSCCAWAGGMLKVLMAVSTASTNSCFRSISLSNNQKLLYSAVNRQHPWQSTFVSLSSTIMQSFKDIALNLS